MYNRMLHFFAEHPRISLQNLIRLVGRVPSTEEEIEILQRRNKLSSRITFHQHRARQLLELSAEEEDDLTYGYADTHVWTEGEDGELTLVPDVDDNPVFLDPDMRQNAERFTLSLPSHLGLETCQRWGLSTAVKGLHLQGQHTVGPCEEGQDQSVQAGAKHGFHIALSCAVVPAGSRGITGAKGALGSPGPVQRFTSG